MAINLPNYERQTEILNNTNDIKIGLAQAGKTPRRQVFTANGTWTVPQGVTRIFVTGGGAGGGGGVSVGNGDIPGNGSSGGATSFGTLLTLSGGGGGIREISGISAKGGIAGGPGGESGALARGGNPPIFGSGGSAGYFKGGQSTTLPDRDASKNGGYCSGGGAAVITGSTGAGGSGDFVISYPLSVIPGTSYPIIIGIGGAGAVISDYVGGDGGNGILIIEWWE